MIRFQVLLLVVFVVCGIAYVVIPFGPRGCYVTSQEPAAAAALKSGFLPAELQAAASVVVDRDHDDIGEYTTLPDLVARNLLAPAYDYHQNPTVTISGYRFALFLPSADGGGIDANTLLPAQLDRASADAREHWFVAYAWPADKDQGRRMFAMAQDGNVYATKPRGTGYDPPAWNALFADGKWGGTPDPAVWLRYRK